MADDRPMHARNAGALRSLLFAPGNHARRREKAFECGADAVILDLEDAVPPAEKAEARLAVAAALALTVHLQLADRISGGRRPRASTSCARSSPSARTRSCSTPSARTAR
jgi:hypothetical protein